ncbi:MAG: type II toxin-antitoxin system VapC family toxin [Planctomycetes bacterium]|nr:type II toxin-antitoxin system VapC family toxin [Planctomycetota bacterium]
MNLFVLDTDMLTLLEEAHPVVSKKVGAVPAEELAVTVATVEEKLTGWYTLIRRAKKPEQFIHAYHRLAGAINLLKPLRVLEVTNSAFERYQKLKSQKLGVGKMDLLIAAITLDAGGTLATRNHADFSKVPELKCVDWSRA